MTKKKKDFDINAFDESKNENIASSINSLSKTLNTDVLIKNLHTSLVLQLKELYKSDKWRYKCQQSIYKNFNQQRVVYTQFDNMEEGKGISEKLLMTFFIELLRENKALTININDKGDVKFI